jgi:battenin
VYFSEYLIQAGVWSAMGFPVTDASARKEFYEYANWTYQAGVVVSRSSGTLWTPTRRKLWLIPALQCGLLVFSIINAYNQIWYNWSVLAMSFVVGLLGGAVYVGGFSLIAMESPLHLKEFNLGAASVANGAGIAFADISSIYLQRSIYKHFNIQD